MHFSKEFTPSSFRPRLVTTKNGKSERVLQTHVCPILDTCGKCALLGLSYKEQLIHKTQDAREKLLALGVDNEFANISIKDCVSAPEALAYRHFVHLMISEHSNFGDRETSQKRRIDIGFYQSDSKYVLDIGRCPVLAIHLNHIVAWLRTGIRIHNVSIHTTTQRTGLLEGVILHSTQDAKQVFVCFVVTKLNSAQMRPLACDIAAKFPNVRGIFMKIKDDVENQNLKLLTGRPEDSQKFVSKRWQEIACVNPSMNEKMATHISNIREMYAREADFLIVDERSELNIHERIETVLNENPKFICFISSLSKSAQTSLNMFKEKKYEILFVEPFDTLPGTAAFENVILLSKKIP